MVESNGASFFPEEANCVVENYVEKRMREAHIRIQELQRMRNIKQDDAVRAVTEWNAWVRWLMPEGHCDKSQTFVIKKTKRGDIQIKKWGEE